MPNRCPNCHEPLTTAARCACGYRLGPGERPKESARLYCQWSPGCRVPIGIGKATAGLRKLCSWHARLVTAEWRHVDLRDEFLRWVAQFQPGGFYERDPGWFWADPSLLWEVVNGRAEVPVLTAEQADAISRRLTSLSPPAEGTA